MKKLFIYAVATVCVIFISSCNINVSEAEHESTKTVASATTTTFNVWGNCDMCKETIEGSLKVPGIANADWNSETKVITVNYDSTVINIDQVHRNIASVGYDTERYKGDDSAYENLHECCKYERKP